MKTMKAVLLNDVRYCKFPEGIESIEEFVENLKENYHSFVKLEFFQEDGCVAPFFIDEVGTIIKYWNPSLMRVVGETEVTIMSRAEYEEKLKKVVQEKCINCANYVDSDSLEGHYDKINLNGECYYYEQKK